VCAGMSCAAMLGEVIGLQGNNFKHTCVLQHGVHELPQLVAKTLQCAEFVSCN
jgi:hypothetical protein